MTSSHDGDSGRGDSDPDTHFSDVTNDCGKKILTQQIAELSLSNVASDNVLFFSGFSSLPFGFWRFVRWQYATLWFHPREEVE